MKDNPYKLTLLDNGLRVVTHQMKDRVSVAVGIGIAAGGRYENDENKGVAHFLEHILFKGSEHYSCSAIKEEVEGVGGSLNAFTSEEQTCYYAKVPAAYLHRSFDVLADMVISPKIPKPEFEKERNVILEEIKMYHDLPQYQVMEMLDELMWPNQPLGKSLAGTAESVQMLKQKDLRHFHQSHYVAKNIVVAACGAVNHNSFVTVVRSKFKALPRVDVQTFSPASISDGKQRLRIFTKEIEQTHLAFGVPGLEEKHPDRYVYYLLHIILGGNMSSRLFNEVREKRGLAYSISSGIKALRDTGMFLISAGVDKDKLVDAVEVILQQLKKIAKSGVEKDEFNRAKEFYLGQVQLNLESTTNQLFWAVGMIMIDDELRTLSDVVKAVKKITVSDVQRVAKTLFKDERYRLAVIGPVKKDQTEQLEKLFAVSR